MLIAIPSDSADGLDAAISEHFGHCAAFTLVAVEDEEIGDVSVLANSAHQEGGCMAPVNLLRQHGVDVLLAGGMGMRPLAGFQQVGIEVRSKEHAESVREAVELYLSGGCRAFGEAETCGGGGGGCGGGHDHQHHHHGPRTVPIDGPADIREGRFVTLDYELKDTGGDALDSSVRSGPLQFVFGGGQIMPGLERAVAGLEPGARVVVELAAADGFGERDESRVIEVSRSQLPPDAEVGSMLTGQDAHGRQIPLIVLELGDSVARLDANHPLAGKDLVFDLVVTKVEALADANEE